MTIDDDVAATLERLRKARDARLKDLVNEALRRGLKDMTARKAPRKPFRTRTVFLGKPRIDNFDNIEEVISFAEGEDHK